MKELHNTETQDICPLRLHRTTRVQFDHFIDSTVVSAFRAEVVVAKTSLESHQLQYPPPFPWARLASAANHTCRFSTTLLESTEVSAVPAEV